jgi:hypothetical protein
LKSKLPFTILTETNLVADFTHDFEKELKKYDILPFLAEEGVLILLKKGPKIINFERSRRLVTLIIDSEEHGKIRIIGIYVPASQQERNEFLPSLESIPSLPGVKTIIGGDFNFVECQEDRTSKYNPKSANLWRLSVAHLNLVEIPPLHHSFTYLASHSPYMARLDRFYLCDNWDTHNFFTEIAKTRISATDDHFQVVLKRKDEEKNRLHWKMNAFLLDDPYTKVLTEELIQSWLNRMTPRNIEVQYLKMKNDLKALFIRHANFRVSRKKKELIHLEQNIIRARLLGFKPRDLEDQRIRVQEEITCNDQLCSRVKWLLEGEKCSKYFSGVLKDRKKTYNMKSIQESEMTEHWKGVFAEQQTSNMIQDKYFPKISQSLAESCENEFSLEEIKAAISGGLTSPGHDGFVSPLFKVSKMPEILQLLFSSWRKNGVFGESRKKIIRMIPKVDFPKSADQFRPISLLDVDYKIYTRVLYNRIKNEVSGIINPDQKGSVSGRFIIENIWQTRFILEKWKKSKEKTELLFFTDFKKAFDSLQHKFIKILVRKMGFGPSFCQIIDNLYSPSSAQIIFNKHLTEEIPILGGVHQGDPLSPLIFILAIEVLYNMLRDSIQGIKIGSLSKLVMGYVDDTTLSLKNSQELIKSLEIFEIFKKSTGLELNIQKCKVLHSQGERFGTQIQGISILQNNENIKSLGYLFNNQNNIDNLLEKIPKFHQTLKKWKSRGLSMKGKVSALKMSGLSQLWYFSYLVDNDIAIKKINTLIKWYLFGGDDETTKATTKASLEILATPTSSLGLGLTHVETQIMALQMKFWQFYFSSQDVLYSWIGEELDHIRDVQCRRLDVPIYAANNRKAHGNTLLHHMIKLAQKFTWAIDWTFSKHDPVYIWKHDDYISRIEVLETSDEPLENLGEPAPKEWFVPNTQVMRESELRKLRWKITLGSKLKDEWTLIKDLTSKAIYNSHVDHVIKTTSTQRNLTSNFAIETSTILKIRKSIKVNHLPPQVTSFILKIYNGILIWWFWRDPKCFHCQLEETWDHVLFDCQRAKKIRTLLKIDVSKVQQLQNDLTNFRKVWIATYVIWTTYCAEAWNDETLQNVQIESKFNYLMQTSQAATLKSIQSRKTSEIENFQDL